MIGSLPYLTLSLTEMEMIHQKTLDLLAHTGIYIDHDGFLTKLREAGAEVDFSTRRAVIPHDMVQSAMLSQSGPASRLHTSSERSPASLLNGVGNSRGYGVGNSRGYGVGNSRGYGEAEGSIKPPGLAKPPIQAARICSSTLAAPRYTSIPATAWADAKQDLPILKK